MRSVVIKKFYAICWVMHRLLIWDFDFDFLYFFFWYSYMTEISLNKEWYFLISRFLFFSVSLLLGQTTLAELFQRTQSFLNHFQIRSNNFTFAQSFSFCKLISRKLDRRNINPKQNAKQKKVGLLSLKINVMIYGSNEELTTILQHKMFYT